MRRIRVFHERLDCASNLLEVEVYDRNSQIWVEHPSHPRIFADTCQTEDTGVLLNEIRTRCAVPENAANWNLWKVGVEVWDLEQMQRCDSSIPARRKDFDVDLEILSPRKGEVLASENLDALIEGRVTLEGRALGRFDVVFLLDVSPGHRRLDADGRAPMYEAIKALRGWVEQQGQGDVFSLGLASFSHEELAASPGAEAPEMDALLASGPDRMLAALDALATIPPASAAGFPEALTLALSQLEARGRAGASRAVVVILDGRAPLPFGLAARRDPDFRQRMIDAAAPARAGDVPVHVLALGGSDAVAPELVDAMFADTPSRWLQLPVGLASVHGLVALPFPQLESIELQGSRARRIDVDWAPGGAFSARVKLEDGINLLRMRVVTSTGEAADANLRITLDNTHLREVLLEREREYMRRVRSRAAGKKVVIEADPPQSTRDDGLELAP